MADVFIAYSRADRDLVRPIAERLASLGYSAYWDAPDAGASEAELDQATVVIVVWSARARSSSWVAGQACRAFDAGKLLQVRLDNAHPPAPFDAFPVADLSGARANWGPLEATLALLVRQGATTPSKTPELGLSPTTANAGAPKLVTFALVTSLAAFCVGLAATRNGAMAADQFQLVLTGVAGVGLLCGLMSLFRLAAIARAES